MNKNSSKTTARKSRSEQHRDKGNNLYMSAFAEGLSPCLQKSRLKDALSWYEKAKNASIKQDEICSASKNLAITSKKLASMLSQSNESVNIRHYYFKEALINFDASYRFSACMSNEWMDKMLVSFQETLQCAIDDVNLLLFEQKMISLNDFAHSIQNANHLRAELFCEITKIRFHHGLSCLQENDYKSCLYQMHECYWPIEQAKLASNHAYISLEVRVLEQDVYATTCMAESAQSRYKGDEILEKLLMEEESLNMDMVWKVVDFYKEAIILTRENDVEMEAIALSRLGNVTDMILKDKIKAKAYFHRSIQLAMSLHPRTFDSEDWFKKCHEVLERYQKEVIQQETEKWNLERAMYLEELKDTIADIKAEDEKGYAALLRYLYEKHPPKGKNCRLLDIPEKSDSSYHSEMKTIFRNAVIHYHPDKVKITDGKGWKVLCEEITKILTAHYEMFK